MREPDLYHTVSIDGMPISPHSAEGKSHIHIVKKLGTNYITLYASDDKSAESACDAIINARARMGLITHIISDPGSEYTSRLVAKVNTFLDINHRVGIVYTHDILFTL